MKPIKMSPEEPIDLIAYREEILRLEPIGERVARWEEPAGACRHIKHVVNADQRKVTCKACGEALDPIFVLLRWIDFWQSQKRRLEYIADFEKKARDREETRMNRLHARRAARENAVWYCDLKSRSWCYESREFHDSRGVRESGESRV